MYISKNNLDIVAWFLFIRSSHRNFSCNRSFKSSSFCNSLLLEILPIIIKNLSDSEESHSTYLNFSKKILSYLQQDSLEELEVLLSDFFEKDHVSINFNNLPAEVEIAMKLALNSEEKGWFYFNKPALNFCNESILSEFQLSKNYIDELIRVFISLDDQMYVAICGDSSAEIIKRVEEELQKYSLISFIKEVPVTAEGKKQWIRLQYAHESHWDERNMSHYMNHPFHGLRIPGSKISLFFFKKKNIHFNIRDLKESFRSKLEKEFPHVHFPDEHREVKWMADAAYNQNSLNWMNNASDKFPENFKILLPEYKKEIANRNDSDTFCLDTGMVLALHGIRDTSDIDFISCGKTEKPIVNHRMESHDSQYENYDRTSQDIIEDPHSHFHYKDVKFCTLNEIQKLKTYRSKLHLNSRNSDKDIKDIKDIDNYFVSLSVLKNNKEVLPSSKNKNDAQNKNHLTLGQRFVKTSSFRLLKSIIPDFLRKVLRDSYIYFLVTRANNKKIVAKISNILG